MTHCRLCRFVCRSRMSVDSETLSSVESMMMIASASDSTMSVPHLRKRLSCSFGAARADMAASAFNLAAMPYDELEV